MSKIICAGHVCIDITPIFPESAHALTPADTLLPGKLLHMDGVSVHTGGAVSNTGLALKILGNDVTLLGKIGEDVFGRMVIGIFDQYGASGLIMDPAVATSYTIVLALPGTDRIFLHDPAANDTFLSADIPEEVFDDAVLFHFGYPQLMRSMYQDKGKELISIFRRAKAHGLITSLDFAAIDPSSEAGKADWEAILKGVLPYTDFIVPSFEELCFILDRSRYDALAVLSDDVTGAMDMMRDAAPLAKKLLELGAKSVMIKCGTRGIYYHTGNKQAIEAIGGRVKLDAEIWADREGMAPCYKVDQVLSAAGAGDTAIAAYLTALLSGKDPMTCARLASAEGALCVTSFDTLSGLKPLAWIEEKLASGWETASAQTCK